MLGEQAVQSHRGRCRKLEAGNQFDVRIADAVETHGDDTNISLVPRHLVPKPFKYTIVSGLSDGRSHTDKEEKKATDGNRK